MPSLYNCKHSGDQYRISKFDSDFNLEASYLCDLVTCECPAGHRPSCRHRSMLPKFILRNYVGTEYFFDFDRGGWVQGWKEEPAEDVASAALLDPLGHELTGLQEEQILMGFHQPELCEPSLAPVGLGQASEARLSTSEILSLPQYNDVPIREVETLPSPSPSPTIRRRV